MADHFRLTDIATIRRGYVDPEQPMFRFNGRPAIGLAIAMAKNGNVLEFGEHIKERLAKVTANLPVGIETHLVADQPHVVEEAVGEFIKTLIEAVAIVLAVSFLSLGWRPGIVVAVAIPLVLAITFAVMNLTGISLQRISLGALIIGLGLLVDDAMIAVEMMMTKLEEGCDKITAATYAYTSTAFPMLTGTLVTIAGFIPVGFAASGAGEYTFTLFAVVAVALVASWVVAVLFTPLIGVFILPDKLKHSHAHQPSRFARAFRALLDRALRVKYAVIGGTVALFIASLAGMQLVQQQFFPSSDRPELLVDLTLPQGSSIKATQKVVDEIEKVLKADPDVERWSFYVGSGAIRFYLPLDQQLANDFFAQAVVVTKGFKAAGGRSEEASRCAAAAGVRESSGARQPARTRAAGRLAAQVPRQRTRSGQSARAGAQLRLTPRQDAKRAQHQLRLERAVEGRACGGRPGSRPHARHQLAILERDHQRGAVGYDGHAGARRHLSRRHRCACRPR